jgi:CubicO group peptidase (beta-lactamase class C family)
MFQAWLCLSLFSIILFVAHPAMSQSIQNSASPAYWPTRGWRSTTPEQQGLDSNKLADIMDYIRGHNINIHSLLIVRNGYVVLDAYFYPYDGSNVHDVASVTKSVTGILVGAAIEQGKIKNVQQRVLPFFANRTISNRDARKERLTVEHLLTMTSGLDCDYKDNEKTLRDMKESDDWVQFMLNLPMVEEPGRKFVYCSGGMHLLSAIISQTVGISERDFARQSLFQPLGIVNERWPADAHGISHGWGDLHLHPRDMAKLGYLWLNQGMWDGKRIVSADWVRESTRAQTGTGTESDYGYGWLVRSRVTPLIYEASGRGGERISVIPAKNMIVVFTGGGFQPSEIGQMLVGAVKSDQPLPDNPTGVARLKELVSVAVQFPETKKAVALPEMARSISGKPYIFETNLLGLKSISLTFSSPEDASVQLMFTNRPTETRRIGLDGVPHISPDGRFGLPVGLKGYWKNKDTFVLEYDEIANINFYRVQLNFSAKQVKANITERSASLKFDLVGRAQKNE